MVIVEDIATDINNKARFMILQNNLFMVVESKKKILYLFQNMLNLINIFSNKLINIHLMLKKRITYFTSSEEHPMDI